MQHSGHRLAYLLLKQAEELIPTVIQPHHVGRVDHPDHGIGLFEVVTPERPQSLLASDVPYGRISFAT